MARSRPRGDGCARWSVGVAPVARRHVIPYRGVLAIAAGAQVGGDALALGKYLDGPRREPDLDRVLREAIRHAVIMALDLDVIIDADPAKVPFGE
jgi:hypothetical protein